MKYILFTIWFLYAVIEGWREARYWYLHNYSPINLEKVEHTVFTIQRGIVAFIMLGWYYSARHEVTNCFYLGFALILGFSFAHNGSYYEGREEIDHSYPLGWWDDSKTSTAKIELNVWVRSILFAIALLILIFLA